MFSTPLAAIVSARAISMVAAQKEPSLNSMPADATVRAATAR